MKKKIFESFVAPCLLILAVIFYKMHISKQGMTIFYITSFLPLFTIGFIAQLKKNVSFDPNDFKDSFIEYFACKTLIFDMVKGSVVQILLLVAHALSALTLMSSVSSWFGAVIMTTSFLNLNLLILSLYHRGSFIRNETNNEMLVPIIMIATSDVLIRFFNSFGRVQAVRERKWALIFYIFAVDAIINYRDVVTEWKGIIDIYNTGLSGFVYLSLYALCGFLFLAVLYKRSWKPTTTILNAVAVSILVFIIHFFRHRLFFLLNPLTIKFSSCFVFIGFALVLQLFAYLFDELYTLMSLKEKIVRNEASVIAIRTDSDQEPINEQ
ncbi:hypothetical protein ENBRE01_1722 [Enteropsectra breve]|nr:hypothetical protein ENBRE01_1018 [Enteropsectra breve]KAI5150806.1 hypothetical protein ENBRE01_1722 [Enteropsectra breve]